MKNTQRVKTSVRMFKEAAQVGARLAHIRSMVLGLTQDTAALELGISRERLANYEDGRTPLKVEVGLNACHLFTISEQWLATGEGDPRMSMNLGYDPVFQEVVQGSFFATAYREKLATRYNELAGEFPRCARLGPFGESVFYDSEIIKRKVIEWASVLNEDDAEKLMRLLIAYGDEFCAAHISSEVLAEPTFFQVGSARDTLAFLSAKLQTMHLDLKLKDSQNRRKKDEI